MERKTPFVEDEWYHIYNRGIDKQKIFFDASDKKHFQKLLYLRNSDRRIDAYRVKDTKLSDIDRGETLVDIAAYALMPNHFHLLVREKSEKGISSFMSKLLTSFSMYMNIKHERTGPLMCRPFRSRHVDSDEYFKWLFSYIHLNPLALYAPEKTWKEKGIRNQKRSHAFLMQYAYTSYPDYHTTSPKREEAVLLKRSIVDQSLFDVDPLFDVSTIDEFQRQHVLGES